MPLWTAKIGEMALQLREARVVQLLGAEEVDACRRWPRDG